MALRRAVRAGGVEEGGTSGRWAVAAALRKAVGAGSIEEGARGRRRPGPQRRRGGVWARRRRRGQQRRGGDQAQHRLVGEREDRASGSEVYMRERDKRERDDQAWTIYFLIIFSTLAGCFQRSISSR
jgi:hypothetical protein